MYQLLKSTALEHDLLSGQVLHISCTIENICDPLRTEVRGVDTNGLSQQHTVRSSSMAGHTVLLIPLV